MTIDVQDILKGALQGAPLSLRDDPTAWGEQDERDQVSYAVVHASLEAAAKDSATSMLAKAFGKEAERIATRMDAAIVDDGPLADLAAIWAEEVTGVDTYPLDATPIHEAADWQARVDALRGVMASVVERLVTPDRFAEPAAALVDTMIELDPRLEHLKADNERAKAVADTLALGTGVLHVDNAGKPTHVPFDDFVPPAFLTRDEAPGESGEHADIVWEDVEEELKPKTGADYIVLEEEVSWDDEPAAAPPAPVRETGRRGRGKRNGQPVPKLCGLLEAAGFQDKEVAALLGIDKSYYSLMRSGKRPWQGLRDDTVAALAKELDNRRGAIDEAGTALMTSEVRLADTP